MAHVGEEGALCPVASLRRILRGLQFASPFGYLSLQSDTRKLQASEAGSMGRKNQRHHRQARQASEPPCCPPWRQNRDRKCRDLRVPDAIVIRRLHLKDVVSGWEARVRG